jgi:hypothetical protein
VTEKLPGTDILIHEGNVEADVFVEKNGASAIFIPKTILPLKPAVYCDRCPRALIYDEIDGRRVLRHDNWPNCERAGQVFEAPTIELRRIG